jgi:DNA-binding MarR family transcriptional regulator
LNETALDTILEDLSVIVPLLHKKLLKMHLGGVTGNLTRHHLGIMGMLRGGSKTASELARVAVVTKPQMTHLIDQLVKAGVVERHADSVDRRVTNIALTSYGLVLLDDLKRKVQENIRNELAGLAPEDLEEMSQAMETLKRISARL